MFCQLSSTEGYSTELLLKTSRDIIDSAGTCALITLDKEGIPRVRTMAPFAPEEDMTIWFGSNPASRKIDQIRNNSKVTLYYLDPDESGYVMIHGRAQVVDNPEILKEKWKPEWIDFYPDYPEGYILIEVAPVWLEVISTRLSVTGDQDSWTPPILRFDP